MSTYFMTMFHAFRLPILLSILACGLSACGESEFPKMVCHVVGKGVEKGQFKTIEDDVVLSKDGVQFVENTFFSMQTDELSVTDTYIDIDGISAEPYYRRASLRRRSNEIKIEVKSYWQGYPRTFYGTGLCQRPVKRKPKRVE